jgi:hypothetical protein
MGSPQAGEGRQHLGVDPIGTGNRKDDPLGIASRFSARDRLGFFSLDAASYLMQFGGMNNNETMAQTDDLGDGYTNEYQRCYAESRLNRPLQDQRPCAKFLHAIGRVVVVAQYEVCCPVTDGLIGYDFVVCAHFSTHAQAVHYLGADGDLRDWVPDERYIYDPAPEIRWEQ